MSDARHALLTAAADSYPVLSLRTTSAWHGLVDGPRAS
jgi:hypothetical protein